MALQTTLFVFGTCLSSRIFTCTAITTTRFERRRRRKTRYFIHSFILFCFLICLFADLFVIFFLKKIVFKFDQVAAVVWNPTSAEVLLTGSFDKHAAVLDARAPDVSCVYNECVCVCVYVYVCVCVCMCVCVCVCESCVKFGGYRHRCRLFPSGSSKEISKDCCGTNSNPTFFWQGTYTKKTFFELICSNFPVILVVISITIFCCSDMSLSLEARTTATCTAATHAIPATCCST